MANGVRRLSSVTLVHPTVLRRLNFSAIFLHDWRF